MLDVFASSLIFCMMCNSVYGVFAQVKGVMRDNVNKVMERGDRLDHLEGRAGTFCTWMCLCVCYYLCTQVYLPPTHAHTHAHTHARTHTHAHTRTHTHTHTHTHTMCTFKLNDMNPTLQVHHNNNSMGSIVQNPHLLGLLLVVRVVVPMNCIHLTLFPNVSRISTVREGPLSVPL